MESQQTANDYKEYFLNKFVNLFQLFVNDCIENVSNNEIKSDLDKIKQLFLKLNYEI